jgi:hypothetical protein
MSTKANPRHKPHSRSAIPMAVQMNFKRREVKYLITDEQRERLMQLFAQHMVADEWGASTVCNVYYDTPSQLLIRRSLDKPEYKEKIRVRSYGPAKPGKPVFLELKKKYDGIVYKRRCSASLSEVDAFFAGEHAPATQIEREIDFAIRRYEGIFPYVYLAYDREAFYGANDHDFRVTFDENILFRDYDMSLGSDIYGTPLLKDGKILMEIKCSGGIPLWMTQVLSEEHIYKTSFSKYGTAYSRYIQPEMQREAVALRQIAAAAQTESENVAGDMGTSTGSSRRAPASTGRRNRTATDGRYAGRHAHHGRAASWLHYLGA